MPHSPRGSLNESGLFQTYRYRFAFSTPKLNRIFTQESSRLRIVVSGAVILASGYFEGLQRGAQEVGRGDFLH